MHDRAEWLIKHLRLQAHPEGGYYRETYRAPLTVFSTFAGAERNAMTHIYFLLKKDQVSRLHRVVHDELWIFLEGAALQLHCYDPIRHTHAISGIGIPEEQPGQTGADAEKFLFQPEPAAVVTANTWQAAESSGDYTLVSCVVAPGFDFQDFTLIEHCDEESREILKFWPDVSRFI